jgi:hypothetical protein
MYIHIIRRCMYISSANKSDLSYLSPSSLPCQVKMGLHSYSCLYGTLLGNSMKERDGARIGKRTLSLWSLLNPRNPEVVNHLFTTAGPRVLRPEANTRKMELWRAMFLAPCLTPSSALSSTHTPNTTTTSTSVSSTAPSTSTQVYSSTENCYSGHQRD